MDGADFAVIELPALLSRLDQVQALAGRAAAEAVANALILELSNRLLKPNEPWSTLDLSKVALERVIGLLKDGVDEVTLKTLELGLAQVKAKMQGNQ